MPTNVACPPDEALAAFARGRFPESAATVITTHLEECPTCRERINGLSADSFMNRLQGARPGETSRPASSVAQPRPATNQPPGPVILPPGLTSHPDYSDIKELGRGGMGVVYLAQHKLLKRWEVLKVMDGGLLSRTGAEDRFLQEVQAAARLQHPNVVKAYTATRLEEQLVFAMEYVPGEDLAKLVRTRGRLTVARAAYFAAQAALGLQHAFENGMVHRDIKPQNLMVGKDGKKAVVKILDFGLAKLTSERKVDAGLTRSGVLMGTPDYMAPEQARDAARADIRADIYSLGCTLYFLLTGRPPFAADSLIELIWKHASEVPPRLDQVRTDVPTGLAEVAARMLEKDPARRYQTPAAVVAALKPFLSQTGPAAPKPASPAAPAAEPTPPDPDLWKTFGGIGSLADGDFPRRRRPAWVWPTAAGLVLALVLIPVLLLWAVRDRTPTVRSDPRLAADGGGKKSTPRPDPKFNDPPIIPTPFQKQKEHTPVGGTPGRNGKDPQGPDPKPTSPDPKPPTPNPKPVVAPLSDVFVANSIWEGFRITDLGPNAGNRFPFKVVVTSRTGSAFTGTAENIGHAWQIAGSVDDRKVEWKVIRPLRGESQGQQHTGTFDGTKLTIKYDGPGDGGVRIRGSGELTLAHLPAPVDLFKPNSKWTGNFTRQVQGEPRAAPGSGGGGPFELTVLTRTGNEFTARVRMGVKPVEFDCRGTIENGKIEWKGKDIKAPDDFPRHDYRGLMQGNQLSLTYSGFVAGGKTPVGGEVKADLVGGK